MCVKLKCHFHKSRGYGPCKIKHLLFSMNTGPYRAKVAGIASNSGTRFPCGGGNDTALSVVKKDEEGQSEGTGDSLPQ